MPYNKRFPIRNGEHADKFSTLSRRYAEMMDNRMTRRQPGAR